MNEFHLPIQTNPRNIIDAGANIGLATLSLQCQYPQCQIVSVEPDKRSFEILEMNVAGLPNITTLCAAVWTNNEPLFFENINDEPWSLRVTTEVKDALTTIPAVRIADILKIKSWECVDLLKMDIEGAEKEVLTDSSDWIGKIGVLLVESHDRFKPGCTRAIYQATSGFLYDQPLGEKHLFSKSPLK